MVKQEVEDLLSGFSRDDVIIVQDRRVGFRLGVERIDCGRKDGLSWRGMGRCQSGACNIADLGLERRRGSSHPEPARQALTSTGEVGKGVSFKRTKTQQNKGGYGL